MAGALDSSEVGGEGGVREGARWGRGPAWGSKKRVVFLSLLRRCLLGLLRGALTVQLVLGDEEQVMVEPIDLLAAELLAARDLGLDELDPIRDRELRSRRRDTHGNGHNAVRARSMDAALTGAVRSSTIFCFSFVSG